MERWAPNSGLAIWVERSLELVRWVALSLALVRWAVGHNLVPALWAVLNLAKWVARVGSLTVWLLKTRQLLSVHKSLAPNPKSLRQPPLPRSAAASHSVRRANSVQSAAVVEPSNPALLVAVLLAAPSKLTILTQTSTLTFQTSK